MLNIEYKENFKLNKYFLVKYFKEINMNEIILVKPTKEYENQMIEYKEEHIKNNENVIHASSRWDKMSNYDEWLNLLNEQSSFKTIKDNWTVHTTFLGVKKSDNKVVGMIDIRHELINDFLRNYAGHIGYGIRPTERKKGYATQMLSQALKFCKNNLELKRVMIACDKENIRF